MFHNILCRIDLNQGEIDATLMLKKTKPIDVLIEGLVSKESGGGRTRIELFVQYLFTWEDAVRRDALDLKR